MAVDRYAGPNSDQKEERRGVIRNILSDMLDVTSKKDRRIEIDQDRLNCLRGIYSYFKEFLQSCKGGSHLQNVSGSYQSNIAQIDKEET